MYSNGGTVAGIHGDRGACAVEQARTEFRMVLSQMDAGKALTAAAAKGNASEVQRILEECRVHPDTRNEFGRTALQVRPVTVVRHFSSVGSGCDTTAYLDLNTTSFDTYYCLCCSVFNLK